MRAERISDLYVASKTKKAVIASLCGLKDEGYFDSFWDVEVNEFYESDGLTMADVEFKCK